MEGEEEENLRWIDEKFLKAFARIYYLNLIEKGYSHGYELIKFVENNYGFKLSPSSIYPLLQELEKKGYIKGSWSHSEGKPDKRTYTLTPRGKRLLKQARERIDDLIAKLSK